jgi:hypothetical protein
MSKRNGGTMTVEEPPVETQTVTLSEYLEQLDEHFEENKDWLDADSRYGYVYFIEACGFLKVGFARDVRERIKGLQTGCPNEISLLDAIADESAQWLEKVLHYFLESHRHHGEWFKLTGDELEEVADKFEEWTKDMAKQVRHALTDAPTKISLDTE